MDIQKPLPVPDADTRAFWEGCRDHRLRFQKCGKCGLVRWPPSIICPECHSQEHGWIVSSGKGEVFTYAVYHQAFHPAFQNEIPYIVAVIHLEEGPRILSNLVDCSHDRVRCGMPVQVVWEDRSPDFSIPRFRPARGSKTP